MLLELSRNAVHYHPHRSFIQSHKLAEVNKGYVAHRYQTITQAKSSPYSITKLDINKRAYVFHENQLKILHCLKTTNL